MFTFCALVVLFQSAALYTKKSFLLCSFHIKIFLPAAREKINSEFHKNKSVSDVAAVEEVSTDI